jgi:hypothetical protein
MPYDDEQDDYSQNAPKALREALEKAQKALAAAQAENASLAKQVSSAKLTDILREKNVPPKIQRWIKRDEVDSSPEAVDKWLAENGEDFGWTPGSSAKEPEGEQSKPEEAPAAQTTPSVLSDEDVAAYQRANQLSAQGVGQTITSDQQKAQVDAVAAQLTDNPEFTDVIKLLAAQGIEVQGSLAY